MVHFSDITGRDIRGHAIVYKFDLDFKEKCLALWFSFFKESVDDIPEYPDSALRAIRDKYFSLPFYRKYAFIEFVAKELCEDDKQRANFTAACNKVLERERSAFRFAGSVLVKISNETDLGEIEESVDTSPSSGVRNHIRKAAELYSATPPDYRNSIKESISSVEAAVSYVAGRKTMGVAPGLRPILETLGIHPALMQGFEKIYAFAGDADGIRHFMFEESKCTQADARYMLVACSAFSNYLIAKSVESP